MLPQTWEQHSLTGSGNQSGLRMWFCTGELLLNLSVSTYAAERGAWRISGYMLHRRRGGKGGPMMTAEGERSLSCGSEKLQV